MKSKRQRFFAHAPRLTFVAPAAPAAGGAAGASPMKSAGTLKGYPLVWNSLSTERQDYDGTYKVRLLPNSATFVTPTAALFTHDYKMPLGTTANGTLRILPPDDFGQSIAIDLPDTTGGNDVATLVRDGYVSGMSFAMVNGFEDSFETTEGGVRIVNCKTYTVDEVTVCMDPAFTDTSIEADFDDEDEDDEMGRKRPGSIRLARVRLNRLRLAGLLI